MRIRQLVAAVCVSAWMFGAAPAVAEAYSWWGWLEELSGPGPYHGFVLPVEIFCFAKPSDADVQQAQKTKAAEDIARIAARRCNPSRTDALVTLQLELGWWFDDPNGRYVGDTKLVSSHVIAYFPLHRILPTLQRDRWYARAFEVGGGLGFYRLTGTTIRESEWWRGAVPLRARVIFSELFVAPDSKMSARTRRLLQSFQFRAGWDFLPGRVSSDAFNGLPNVDVSNEFVGTTSFQVDVGTLLWSLKR